MGATNSGGRYANLLHELSLWTKNTRAIREGLKEKFRLEGLAEARLKFYKTTPCRVC